MFKRAIGVLVLVGLSGCSVPDGDAWDRLVDSIGAIPSASQQAVRSIVANDAIRRHMADMDRNDVVSDLVCEDRSTPGAVLIELALNVGDILDCVREAYDRSYSTCVDRYRRAAEISAVNRGYDAHCYPRFRPGWDPLDLPTATNEDRLTDDDIARDIVSMTQDELVARPALMTALGLVVVGGMIVALPASGVGVALCPLSTAVECPPHPDGTGTEPVASSGGDHR